MPLHITRVSCQKGPNRHAYAWQIGPFWQDTLELDDINTYVTGDKHSKMGAYISFILISSWPADESFF